jgi:hypothetical protein
MRFTSIGGVEHDDTHERGRVCQNKRHLHDGRRHGLGNITSSLSFEKALFLFYVSLLYAILTADQ